MPTYPARVREICLNAQGQPQAWVDCPPAAVPAAGQYGRARSLPGAVLAQPLFPAAFQTGGFLAAAPLPETWLPGLQFTLNTPQGHGFALPASARRVALAALSGAPDRLLPLVGQALGSGADVVLFCDAAPGGLPSQVEISPLKQLAENLPWADFLALDLLLEQSETLGARLGLSAGHFLPCPGQALVFTPMPCSGLAACGACAVRLRRGWKLACSDGPVFHLGELL